MANTTDRHAQNQKITWTELLVWGWIKEKQKKTQNIPVAIKYLIKKWTRKSFHDSHIISFRQDFKLSTLMESKLLTNKMNYQLLFRASENKYSSQAFHAACDSENDNCKTIVIAQSEWGNIFGGYTSKSWSSSSEKESTSSWSLGIFKKDSSAFLFLLHDRDKEENKKCPIIFNITPQSVEYAICCLAECGPLFGEGADLYLREPEKSQSSTTLKSYANSEYNKEHLCGGNNCRKRHEVFDDYVFDLVDYEVYKVIDK